MGSPIGSLTITGDYVQTASGIWNVKIGGVTSSAFDALNVSGDVSLNGALSINLVDGFVPETSDSFEVLTLNSEVGDFATSNKLKVSNKLSFILACEKEQFFFSLS